jgi:hypothetical protein
MKITAMINTKIMIKNKIFLTIFSIEKKFIIKMEQRNILVPNRVRRRRRRPGPLPPVDPDAPDRRAELGNMAAPAPGGVRYDPRADRWIDPGNDDVDEIVRQIPQEPDNMMDVDETDNQELRDLQELLGYLNTDDQRVTVRNRIDMLQQNPGPTRPDYPAERVQELMRRLRDRM